MVELEEISYEPLRDLFRDAKDFVEHGDDIVKDYGAAMMFAARQVAFYRQLLEGIIGEKDVKYSEAIKFKAKFEHEASIGFLDLEKRFGRKFN